MEGAGAHVPKARWARLPRLFCQGHLLVPGTLRGHLGPGSTAPIAPLGLGRRPREDPGGGCGLQEGALLPVPSALSPYCVPRLQWWGLTAVRPPLGASGRSK